MPVTEADVAITEHLGSHAPFRAVLKQNIDDFVVQEVTLSGAVLSPQQLPQHPPRPKHVCPKPRATAEPPPESKGPPDDAAYAALDATLPGAGTAVRELLESDDRKSARLPPCKEKEARKKVHEWIRTHTSRIDSETDQTPDGPVIHLVRERGRPLKRRRADPKPRTQEQEATVKPVSQSGDVMMGKEKTESESDPVPDSKPGTDATPEAKPEPCPEPLTNPLKEESIPIIQPPPPVSTEGGEREGSTKTAVDAVDAVDADAGGTSSGKAGNPDPAPVERQLLNIRRNTIVQFVLWKSGRDTWEALKSLGYMLKVPANSFAVAGTKDKRGVTMQLVTVRGVREGSFATANWREVGNQRRRGRSTPTMVVSDVAIAQRMLQLGDLRGNQFTIVLRDVDADDENVCAAVQSVRERGFVNYFGLQRFGSGISGTHETGFAMMREDMEDVCRRLLLPVRAGEADGSMREPRRVIVEALDKFSEKKISAVELTKALPRWMTVENSLAQSFAGQERHGVKKYDYGAAFGQLPRNMRKMYGHAVQSYLWNVMASERIRVCRPDAPERMFAIEGDLVLANDTSDAHVNSDTPVRSVTAEEAANKSVSIYRVVIPVIGAEVPVPDTTAGRAANAALEREKCSVESFSSRSLPDRMKGTYRKLMAMPPEVEFELVSYTRPSESLIHSFVEPLLAKERAQKEGGERKAAGMDDASSKLNGECKSDARPAEFNGAAAAAATDGKPPGETDGADTTVEETRTTPGNRIVDATVGKTGNPSSEVATTQAPDGQDGARERVRKGVVLKFTLGTASYATMLVRELTKNDSSVSNQKSMQEGAADR